MYHPKRRKVWLQAVVDKSRSMDFIIGLREKTEEIIYSELRKYNHARLKTEVRRGQKPVSALAEFEIFKY